ncbi:MAG: twin-arginine translocation signal domain-containing protein, partial [Eggerthellaceae bacterium]|nr:twin-arginine translocation signal domain-containing protein [Eggerthellaceae bacterium]
MQKEERKISRRGFLATSAAVVGGAAALSALGCKKEEPLPTPTPAPVTPPEESYYIGTCRGNCGGKCALKATVREGKIVSTMPLTFDRQYEGVQHGCMKGVTNPLRIYGTNRLYYPMKLVGERGSGKWERI